jgi:hypothetical protein
MKTRTAQAVVRTSGRKIWNGQLHFRVTCAGIECIAAGSWLEGLVAFGVVSQTFRCYSILHSLPELLYLGHRYVLIRIRVNREVVEHGGARVVRDKRCWFIVATGIGMPKKIAIDN